MDKKLSTKQPKLIPGSTAEKLIEKVANTEAGDVTLGKATPYETFDQQPAASVAIAEGAEFPILEAAEPKANRTTSKDEHTAAKEGFGHSLNVVKTGSLHGKVYSEARESLTQEDNDADFEKFLSAKKYYEFKSPLADAAIIKQTSVKVALAKEAEISEVTLTEESSMSDISSNEEVGEMGEVAAVASEDMGNVPSEGISELQNLVEGSVDPIQSPIDVSPPIEEISMRGIKSSISGVRLDASDSEEIGSAITIEEVFETSSLSFATSSSESITLQVAFAPTLDASIVAQQQLHIIETII